MKKQIVILIIIALSIFSISGCKSKISSENSNSSAPAKTQASERFPIEAQPAHGEVHGLSFRCESSEIEDGILKLRQGKDFFADEEVTIFLLTPEGRIPSGGIFQVVEGESYEHSRPHVTISWKEGGANMPKYKSFAEGFTLYLEFGEPRGKKLPGKIYLKISDKPATFVEGTFDAEIKGLFVAGGKAGFN